MNRKGDLAVLIFVLLVLALLGMAMASFIISKGRTVGGTQDPGAQQNFYVGESRAEFYAKMVSGDSAVRVYDSMAAEGRFFERDALTSEGILIVNGFDEEFVKEEFVRRFDGLFEREFDMYEFKDKNLQRLSRFSGFKEKRKIIATDEGMAVSFPGFPMYGALVNANGGEKWHWLDYEGQLAREGIEEQEDIVFESSYESDIFADINFEVIGLHTPKEIYSAIEKCKTESFEECLSSALENFDVVIGDRGAHYLVEIESRRKFPMLGDFRRVKLTFLVVK